MINKPTILMALKNYLSCFLLLSAFGLTAQTLENNLQLDNSIATISSEVVADDNWTFYADEHLNLLYVDLELLGGFATDLVIENEEGEIVLTEELMDIPKNSIYELDLSDLEKGNYSLKIRTYQEVVQQNVKVK